MLHSSRKFNHALQFLVAGLVFAAAPARALNKNVTVAASGRGDFTSLQAAINDCDPLQDVCTINIADGTTILKAPIWIEGKANITIVGSAANGAKSSFLFSDTMYDQVTNPNPAQQTTVPKLFTLSWQQMTGTADPERPAGWLMWPMKGSSTCSTPTNGPVGMCSDTSSTYSTSGFQHNGMFVVKKSRDITFRNLRLSGRPVVFQNNGIWSGQFAIVHGTVGINIFQSLRVKSDGMEITGFFSGYYINGRNVGGMFGAANPDDWDTKNIVPLSRYGQVGDHEIQRNYLHDNWWGFYFESSWDKASRIHHNVIYNCINKAFQYKDSLKNTDAKVDEMNNQTGGMAYVKDAVLAVDRFYNNTILRTSIVMGYGGWRASSQELFYNNVFRGSTEGDAVAGKKIMDDWHQRLKYYGVNAWSNSFQLKPGSAITYTSPTNIQLVDTGVRDQNNNTCARGCWMTLAPTAKVRYIQQMQPQFVWDPWKAQLGVDYVVSATDITWPTGYTGYTGKTWTVHDNNGNNLWGVVTTLAPATLAANIVQSRNNLYATALPTVMDSTKLDTTYRQNAPSFANILQLSPQWSDTLVRMTIRNRAWKVDNVGNPDGTPSDRGAFCFDSTSRKTLFGCPRSGPVLSLDDQQIVGLKGTTASLPMIVKQTDGLTGAASSGYSSYHIDSIYYYDTFPYSKIPAPGSTTDPDHQKPYTNPVKISTATWSGTSGSNATFTLPKAVTNDFARFDVFMSATDPITGQRVTTIGVYFYRKLQYQLVVKFCSSAACTDSLTSTRVGDQIYMQTYITDAAGAKLSTQQASRIYVTPGAGVNMRNLTTPPGTMIDTAQVLASFTGSFTMPIEFETKGAVAVTVAGVVGPATSAVGVMGVGSINIKAGRPYQVQFTTPQTFQTKLCGGDMSDPAQHFAGNPSDTSNKLNCNEMPSITPNQGALIVYDKFGNLVDTTASVQLDVAPTVYLGVISGWHTLPGSITKVGATAATATAGTATTTITTDSAGNGVFYVLGDPVTGPPAVYTNNTNYPWILLTGKIAGLAGGPVDSAISRLMPPAGHLEWKSPAGSIDTFVLTPVPVTLFLTKNGIDPDIGNTSATALVNLSAFTSSNVKFYSDAAMTQQIDTVRLVAGQASFYVAGSRPVALDSILGTIAGFSTTPGKVVKFKNPPQPPTPRLKAAVFYDGTCDSLADVVVVSFDPASTPATLDTSKVQVNYAKLVVGTDSIILDPTALSLLQSGAAVSFPIPLASQHKLAANAPTATLVMYAALIRDPAHRNLDTIVSMGSVLVTDGIGPRPVLSAIVENSATGTAPDTLKVQFSEPVNYTGSTFPFLVFASNGTTPIATTGFAVTSVTGSGSKTLTFVVTGNTGSLAEGDVLAINAGSGLSDLAGNDGRYTQCGNDTTHLQLQPVAVPIDRAWISDVNGDGKADQITVVFRRDFRTTTEAPNSLQVDDWNGLASTNLPWSTAVQAGTATYTLPLSTAALGGTVGAKPDGTGTLTLIQGALRREPYTLVDSVAPIAIGKAKLTLGSATTGDKLVVTYSEPVTQATGTVWMTRQRGDASLAFTNPTKNASGTVWTFTVPSGTVLVGDSIRMALAQSALKAVSGGQVPASSGNAPFIPVVGGDPAPDSAYVLDVNGDGTADAVRLVYHNPLFGNPSFSFVWNGATVNVDSIAYGKSLKGKLSDTLPVTGFPTGVTAGNGTGTSTSLVDGTAADPLPFVLIDGVAPVLDSIFVRFASEDGLPDTILVRVSESVTSPNLATLLTFSPSPITLTPYSALIVADPTHYMLLTAPGTPIPGFGDSARLAVGNKDGLDNAVANNSRRVPVLTGPHPVKYHAGVYPVAVQKQTGAVDPTVAALPDVTVWIIPPANSTYGSKIVRFDPSTGSITPGESPEDRLDAPVADGNLMGIRVDISTSFDGQVMFYDNLGVFVGRTDLKIDLHTLDSLHLVAPNGKYSVFAAIHSSNDVAKQLASGVYMARLIGYSEQIVNGEKTRIMIQNKLFKFGHFRPLK